MRLFFYKKSVKPTQIHCVLPKLSQKSLKTQAKFPLMVRELIFLEDAQVESN